MPPPVSPLFPVRAIHQGAHAPYLEAAPSDRRGRKSPTRGGHVLNPSAPHRTARAPLARAASFLLALLLLLGALPAAAATPTTGVWIFPNAHRDDAVADALDDAFYIADNSSEWIADSFFADSIADSASVSVDLYNPTSTDLTNVQVFAAVSDSDLFTDLSFAGGDSGDVTVLAADLSGGTPFLADGSSFPAHGVYPASFTSYGVGDLDAGSSNIRTITVEVTGDFAGGLIVHLDYSAEDASGAVYTGPFGADMNILENGEPEEECADAVFSLDATPSTSAPAPGKVVSFDYHFELVSGDPAEGLLLALEWSGFWALDSVEVAEGSAIGVDPGTGTGTSQGSGGTPTSGNVTVNATASNKSVDGDSLENAAELSWELCDGSEGSTSASLSAEVTTEPAEEAESSGYWRQQFKQASTGTGNSDLSADDLALLLQRVALHSQVFTYGPWDGTDPWGGDDEGWVDIGTLDDALDVLRAHGKESKMSNKAERELLALWLNVASGALNLDTVLERHEGDGDDEDANEDDEASTPSTAYDTVGEIITFASGQLDDWSDGVGASADDLKLAKRLCKWVNQGSLGPA